jgi:hypothetical protein
MELTAAGQSEYVAARRVLLDALAALGCHRSSVVLVGAQAIYLRSGAGGLAVAPMTTDADLALHVDWIKDEPELYAAMLAAGFLPATQPGTWQGRGEICIDLMVVPHQGGRSSRAARAANLPPHRKGVARIARGLEPALVDHGILPVGSLERSDGRSYEIRIAGPSALLVAKIIKLSERMAAEGAGARSRVHAKDALDVYRLLRATEVMDFVAGFGLHAAEAHAAAVSREAVAVLRDQGTHRDARLPQLASQALGGDPIAAASFVALAVDLIKALAHLDR